MIIIIVLYGTTYYNLVHIHVHVCAHTFMMYTSLYVCTLSVAICAKLLVVTSGPKLVSRACRDLRSKALSNVNVKVQRLWQRMGQKWRPNQSLQLYAWNPQWKWSAWNDDFNGQWSNHEQWGNHKWSDDKQWGNYDELGRRPHKKPKGTYFTKEEHFAGACPGVTLDIEKAALVICASEDSYFPVAWLI